MLSELAQTGVMEAIIGTTGSLKNKSRSRWPRGLRCGSVAASLLGLRVRTPPGLHEYLCLVNVACSQVKVYASGRSLIQRSPAD